MADTTTRFAKETAQVHKRFDIDKSETVITHYACAHKGRVLKQGRLYISQNYLCFYAQIVGKTHKKTINFSDVSDLSKANFGVFPNAIKITTRKNKEILFTSFLMRDQAYDAIRQQWLCLSSRIDCSQDKDKEHEKEKSKKEKKEKKEKKDKRSSKSLSPSGADQCSESESDKETEKKKKKKRWSLTKKKSDASDSMNSDSDIGSDVSSSKSNRRASTCSTSSLDRHNSDKDSAPGTPTSSTVRRASCSAAPVSTPFSLSTPSASPSASPSLSSIPPPSPSSRGERAQALLDSGAFVPVPLELSNVNNSVHDGTSQAGDHPSESTANPPTLWQKMCSCF